MKLAVKIEAALGFVAALGGIDLEFQQVADLKTRIEILQIAQASNEQTGADQQQQRQRHLRHHQRLTDSHGCSAGDGTDLVLQRSGQLRARRLQGGHEPENSAGQQRDTEGE